MESWSSPSTTATTDSNGEGRQEVFRLLEAWRHLTELEGTAICREDWASVAGHQNAKAALQEALTTARQREQTQGAAAPSGHEDQRLRALVSEVMALEQRNREVLSAKRQHRQEELQRLNQANRQLHGVRRAYGSSSRSCWQSYS